MDPGRSIRARARLFALLLLGALAGSAAVYEVGEGKPLTSIGQAPWASLQPGDIVLIHWRPSAYREKWVISRQGTAAQPITVRGVAGPGGQLPVIDGASAVTAPGLNYWSETRGIVKIGGSNTPPDVMPRHIVVENLEILNAHQPYTFTDDGGSAQSYTANSAAIFIEKGENITIRNCILRNNGNGLFVASSNTAVSRDILVQGNYIYDNGNVGSAFEHNSYTAGVGLVFEYNRYGPPLAGSIGNALKDRSAGTVVRYNWIEGGNRQLDLVDAEDSVQIRNDAGYSKTHVYGNVLIEPAGAGNRQIVHYGGDSGATATYRKGTLYFYNNTVVSTRTDRNTLMRLSTNDERCDARNNIFYSVLAGSDWSMLDNTGVLDLSHNWIKPGWVNSFTGGASGIVNNDGTMIQGAAPGFVNEAAQDFALTAGSANVNAGAALAPAVVAAHSVLRQYVKHRSGAARPADATLDVGAFERFLGSRVGVYSGGQWALDRSGDGVYQSQTESATFGFAGATPITGDWNGDGRDKIGVFKDGFWFLDYDGNGVWDGGSVDKQYQFGRAGVTPFVGDWNGDGRDKIGIFDNGFWFLDKDGNGIWGGPAVDIQAEFGWNGVTPLVGDWNGDGRDKIAVFINGFWFLDYNGNALWDGPVTDRQAQFGWNGVTPLTGDWNGDGRKKIGIFIDGFWFLDKDGDGLWGGSAADVEAQFGWNGVTPLPGDWNGDGREKIGIFIDGQWYLDYDGSAAWDGVGVDRAYSFGQSGQVPRVGRW